jgi:hypothetical protein
MLNWRIGEVPLAGKILATGVDLLICECRACIPEQFAEADSIFEVSLKAWYGNFLVWH